MGAVSPLVSVSRRYVCRDTNWNMRCLKLHMFGICSVNMIGVSNNSKYSRRPFLAVSLLGRAEHYSTYEFGESERV